MSVQAPQHLQLTAAAPRRPGPLATAGLTATLTAALAVAAALPAAAAPARPAVAAQPPESVLAWGANVYGELGNGTTTASNTPGAVKLPAGLRFTVVRCQLSCFAVTTTGRVYAWGDNNVGQLGDGTTKERLTPVAVKLPAGVKVKAVRAGGSFVLALTTAGKVLGWGADLAGQLGNGSTRNRLKPVAVKLPKGVKIQAISAADESGLALTTTGKLLSWGGNGNGQLGTGNTKARLVPGPVRLPKHTTVTSIAAGPLTGYAVTSAGRLLAWGDSNFGQLGDGTTRQRDAPVPVKLPAGTKVVAAVSGLLHALALTASGRVLAWGYNLSGQLGNGSTTDRHKPVFVKLPAGVKATALAAGKYDSLAIVAEPVSTEPLRPGLRTSGSGAPASATTHGILAWGDNQAGDLGTGSNTDSDLPVDTHLPPQFAPSGIGSGWGAGTSIAIVSELPA
jgi:alpha-tubulin suppressor-like RCC1 family protein